jgi:hypothetical protein
MFNYGNRKKEREKFPDRLLDVDVYYQHTTNVIDGWNKIPTLLLF